MIVNQTGAGFHRDSRREVRMPRKAEREWAIAEQVPWHYREDGLNGETTGCECSIGTDHDRDTLPDQDSPDPSS